MASSDLQVWQLIMQAGWLVKGLKEEGHVVDHAANGPDGLTMAREQVHDVIIMDRMLPGMDGFALCRQIRREGDRIPVLFLTARSAGQDRIRGLDRGAGGMHVRIEGCDLLYCDGHDPPAAARLRATRRRAPRARTSEGLEG